MDIKQLIDNYNTARNELHEACRRAGLKTGVRMWGNIESMSVTEWDGKEHIVVTMALDTPVDTRDLIFNMGDFS